jgi:Zn-dependent protease
VHLHWSWFLVAVYSISTRFPNYTSPVWAAFEYIALFLIVLMHEFGHAMACRQVGGKADQIVLWPLGGVAYVAAPSRPGATLWSIAAGPLVNVALIPLTMGVLYLAVHLGWRELRPDSFNFIQAVTVVNLVLLGFNLLPVYPLDGGQILRSLLWYPLGKARSLFVATIIGFVGGAALAGVAIWVRSIWFGIMAFFLLSNCWSSFQQARALRRIERFPRRAPFACPSCHSSPPIGEFWRCEGCGHPFDLFAKATICPRCNATQTRAGCVDCGSVRAYAEWMKDEAVVI